MKIVFFDPVNWDYSPITPFQRPLGGTQSAVCYLSTALAKLGHQVYVINNINYSFKSSSFSLFLRYLIIFLLSFIIILNAFIISIYQ